MLNILKKWATIHFAIIKRELLFQCTILNETWRFLYPHIAKLPPEVRLHSLYSHHVGLESNEEKYYHSHLYFTNEEGCLLPHFWKQWWLKTLNKTKYLNFSRPSALRTGTVPHASPRAWRTLWWRSPAWPPTSLRDSTQTVSPALLYSRNLLFNESFY